MHFGLQREAEGIQIHLVGKSVDNDREAVAGVAPSTTVEDLSVAQLARVRAALAQSMSIWSDAEAYLKGSPLHHAWLDLEASLREAGFDSIAQLAREGPGPYGRKSQTMKWPPEAPMELPLMRQAELDAMVEQGREDAEAAVLGAGFLGGNNKVTVALTTFAAIVACYASAHYVRQLAVDRSRQGSPLSVMRSVFTTLVNLSFAIGCSCRLRWMLRNQHKKAYNAVCITGVSAGVCLAAVGMCRIWMGWEGDLLGHETAAWQTTVNGVCAMIIGLATAVTAFMFYDQKRNQAQKTLNFTLFTGAAACIFMAVALEFGHGTVLNILAWLSIACFLCLSASWTFHTRRIRTKEAFQLIEADKAEYDKAWETISTTEEHRDSLPHLEALVGKIRAKDPPGGDALSMSVCKRLREVSRNRMTSKPRHILSSVGVLFAQAAAFNEHFQETVARWADGLALPEDVHKCSVKRRVRAVEKLFRSYQGQADCLIDLVRSGITFPSLAALVDCLERILQDERVGILQVKNRLADTYDSSASAGYRNIAVSLVLVDDFTMHLGLDAHIAELQLGLRDIDKKKNDGGHEKYVQFRNMLAE